MTAENDALIPLLAFRWGNEVYAVPLAAVREVARLGRMTPIPGGSRTIIGAIVLHGEVLPVVDIRGVLGLAASPECTNTGNVLVVRDQGNPADLIGLYVDAIGEVMYVQEAEIRAQEDSPQSLSSRFFSGHIQSQNGDLIHVLHLSQVLGALGRQMTER